MPVVPAPTANYVVTISISASVVHVIRGKRIEIGRFRYRRGNSACAELVCDRRKHGLGWRKPVPHKFSHDGAVLIQVWSGAKLKRAADSSEVRRLAERYTNSSAYMQIEGMTFLSAARDGGAKTEGCNCNQNLMAHSLPSLRAFRTLWSHTVGRPVEIFFNSDLTRPGLDLQLSFLTENSLEGSRELRYQHEEEKNCEQNEVNHPLKHSSATCSYGENTYNKGQGE